MLDGNLEVVYFKIIWIGDFCGNYQLGSCARRPEVLTF